MKRKLYNEILILFATVFVISGALVLRQMHDYRAANKAYNTAQELAMVSSLEPVPSVTSKATTPIEPDLTEGPVPTVYEPTEEETVQEMLDLDLNALRQTNERVLGWIRIPDSPIDYPLLQVQDNNEYLRRTWDGTPNNAGCIFLECKNNCDLSDFNTLVYGHYVRNGKMFGSLHYYREKEYRDAHPCIYIVTDESVRRYEVFSAYEAEVVSNTYRLCFEDDVRKQSVLDYYLDSSVVESELVPTVEDHILTLSTCTGTGTYDTRWVVQAVLAGEFFRGE